MPDGLLLPSHLIVLAIVALVVFGPERIPELGRMLGGGIRELRESVRNAGSGAESGGADTDT